ncbi:RsfA family transcriptional regulator [Oceanobacillus polygoni]|uniref:RsfA family transcription factor n=1 Tax=Oceanobacillus polygoni TaxID=1235259 RepID=A0A9X0YV32_9BACI|nr:RsfA family transcriptional regulator [Oceanobacillus polygoni]MBP2077536.1 RsfA family transcription factor [Oceanobacillus polygoni]
MNDTRQDAWTKDEDIILAETVLRFIREGRTQLEAFKEVASQLSRTSAACGFRWNATIRKQYQNAIQLAKEERKSGLRKATPSSNNNESEERYTIESAILLLEKMKTNFEEAGKMELDKEYQQKLQDVEQENERLKNQLSRYDNAWQEMNKLWTWVRESKHS